MNAFKRITAAALCCGIISLCGCSGEKPQPDSSASTTPFSEESVSTSAFDIPPENTNSETPYLTYLGTKTLDDSPALTEYKRIVGMSAEDLPITMLYTGGGSYEDRLSELIGADESPDLTDKRENTFPLLMSRNMYEDLSAYIDISAPQWTGYAKYIDYYSFKNAHYFYPTTITAAPQFLLYDKMKFVQYNIPDPERLWERGDWTWSALSGSAEELREYVELPVTIGGARIFENMLAANGMPFIEKMENGQFMWNINSEKYVETEHFFFDNACDSSLTDIRALTDGQTAFLSTDESALGKLRSLAPDLNIGIVPYPRTDGEVGKYAGKAVTEGFLVPKGAKNIRSAASFINCSRIVDDGENARKAWHDEMKELGLLRSDTEWIELFRYGGYIAPVLVEGECLDKAANEAMRTLYASYDNAGDEYIGPDPSAIEKCIMNINALL